MANEVYISTALDTKTLEKGVKQAERELENLGKKYEQIQTKQKKFLELGGQKEALSQEYKTASAEVEKYGNKLETLLNRQEKIQETGGKTNTKAYQQLAYEIDSVSEKFWRAEKAKESLEDSKYVPTKQWSQMAYELDETGQKIEQTKAKVAGMRATLDQAKKPRGIEQINKSLIELKSTSDKVKKSLAGMFSKGADIKKGFGGGFKNLLKYTLGIRSLFVLFNRLRNALVDGFKNLAQFNNGVNPVNDSISGLKSSLTNLKNSFATAFAPILTTVAPALTLFIDKISQAVTAMGMLFAKMTGATKFTKAVKVQENYAASLDKTSKSAKKAANSLYAFDELDVVSKTDSGSDSGSGGADPNKMFETVDIPSAFGDISAKLKEAWQNADFSEIGGIVSGKIMTALNSIDWSGAKTTADKLGKSIGTFLTGFFGEEGFAKSVGTALGEGFNTALTFVSSLLNNTDWGAIGSFITTGLQTAFQTLDFSVVGSALSGFISGLYEFAAGLIEGIDWQSLPGDILTAIIEFFKGYNYSKIAKSIARLFGAAFGAVAGLVVGIGKMIVALVKAIVEAWDKKKKEWDKMGISVWEGIAQGIVSALKGIWNWVKENIFKPFWEGLCKAFGIDGKDSKSMLEIGKSIMQGLYNGVKALIGLIGQIFLAVLSVIKNVFLGIGSWFGSIFKGAWKAIKDNFTVANAKAFFRGILTAIKNTFFLIPNWFKEVFSKAWENVKKVFDAGGQIFDGIKDGILDGLKAVINALIDGINSIIKIPFDGLNSALDKVRNVSIVGKKPFEDLIPTISTPQIPKLATGTVVPRQAGEFAAILGDNNRETEVVSPLSTMKQAMAEVLGEYTSNSNGDIYISADGDMDAIIRLFKFRLEKEDKRVGRNFEKVVTV